MSEIPFPISFAFIALTAFLWLQWFTRLRGVSNGVATRFAGISAVWLGIVYGLARLGFLSQFDAVPPRFVFMMLVVVVFLVWLSVSKKVVVVLSTFSQRWLVGLQSFRIVMELILWWLFAEKIIPVQMTFEGLNADVLVGLTALPVLYFYQKNPGSRRRLLLWWNVAGILILTNIVVIAALSTPTVLRQFTAEPANTIIAGFPFVWLPSFVVPSAYALHILSIRKLLNSAG